MVDPDVLRIENAIQKLQESADESDLIEILLQGALNWPLADEDDENLAIDGISDSWDDVLVEMGFSSEDAPIELRQVMPFPNWPHGIFIVRFGSNKFFTQGRGMTTPLRTILRELMEKVSPTADHPSWKKDQILFLCHSETEYFQFARFEVPKGDSKTSKIQMFGWGPNEHIRTVCEYNLKNLIYKDEMNEEDATKAVNSAFDVSKVSNEFYEDYRMEFENAKQFIENNSDLTEEDDIHQATQILFNRILFLRFIEKKKGWLQFGENGNYLEQLFKAGGIDSDTSFYSSRLRRLFFEGLAVEGKGEDPAYGKVPFLSGGLFEENELDKSINDLPDELFERLLGDGGLFYRWNFTVQESTPFDVDVAIDPEMIGTLFEELVTGRNEKGAFYTPRPVVAYMCREAIKSVLKERTDVDTEAIRKLIDDDDNEGLSIDDARTINSVLAEVKAIDPACGSGAYLLGLLHELVRVHTKLSTTAEDLLESRTEMKLRIISNSIYGVDLDRFATIQASLRLWLSISVDATEPELMPNLDMNIIHGDSLLNDDPQWVKKYEHFDWDPDGNRARAKQISIIRKEYISSSGEEKIQLRERWKSLLQEVMESKGEVEKSQGAYFGAIFYDVFVRDNGGFDIVLANPPYVRQEDIDESTKKNWVKNSEGLVSGKSDLYIYFYARAKQILRKGGVSCFICSNTWLDVEFGAPLQLDIIENFKGIRIIDFRKMRIFENAEVNTIISIMEKDNSEDDIDFIMFEDSFEKSIQDPLLRTEQTISKSELKSKASDSKGDYIGYKWSLILRAPEIYHSVINNHSDKLIAIRDVCEKTQRNNMRVLPKDSKMLKESAGDERDRAPFLHSFKDTNGIRLDLSKQKSISHPKIRHVMEGGNFVRPAIISNRFYGARIYFIEGGDFFVNDSFFIGQLHERFNVKNTILALNSTLSLLFVELRGRKGQGGGVLTFYGPEFTGHQIIDPTLLDGIDDAVYDSLVNREIGEVSVECGFDPEIPLREQEPSPLPDRKVVDELIFDILELTQEERNEIYWYLCESVQNREERSKSV
ncbi:MAG: Modification methylase PaeR7I [Euryarchaeota archaeon UBA443]|nr:MAG: Modification methylase PaeR7I [Euryarchaeota archaeon UBA443]